MESLYEKYKNIVTCLTKYRNYEQLAPEMPFDAFKSSMKNYNYAKDSFTNKGEPVDIYLFNCKDLTPLHFRKLLDKYKKQKIHILFFTKRKFNTYIKKSIKEYDNITHDNYLHKHFIMEISRGPLCSTHEILSVDDVRKLCVALKIHPYHLQAIHVTDPQIIWIGAQIYDVVKITSYSELTGKMITYRIVTSTSGKHSESTITKKDITSFNRQYNRDKDAGEGAEGGDDAELKGVYDSDGYDTAGSDDEKNDSALGSDRHGAAEILDPLDTFEEQETFDEYY